MAEEVKPTEKKSREVSPRMTSRTFQQFDSLRDLQRELNKKENAKRHAPAKARKK
ncbi:hypothetical protein SEA_LEWANDO_60 [Arthrobacter phage Lewando]|nr:hypothetical protein SEA_LEWANDO_60 [Arthrobacter phage Lewando]